MTSVDASSEGRDRAGGQPVGHAAKGRSLNSRVRSLALALMSLALAFYFGFIAITIYRSHH